MLKNNYSLNPLSNQGHSIDGNLIEIFFAGLES